MSKSVKKIFLKVLCVCLCITCLIATIPFSATSVEEYAPSLDESISDVVAEAIEYRGEFTKAYRKADGTYVAVNAGEALHFQDDDGAWQEIDNTLAIEKNEDGQEVYTNAANDFSIELPTSIDSNSPVEISKGGYSVSFKLLSKPKASKAQVSNAKARTYKKGQTKHAIDLANPETKQSRMEYANVLDNTDFVYDASRFPMMSLGLNSVLL